jgi:hypothetical protein
MRIVTHYSPQPVPSNCFDWSAIDDSTYDGQESDPIGYGATEREAILNLLEMIEDID